MRLWEALKTGKQIRRKDQLHWISPYTAKAFVLLTPNDVESDDWEIKEEKPKWLAYRIDSHDEATFLRLVGGLNIRLIRCPWLDEPWEP